MNDIQAYQAYPHLRHWYNKLWLSEQLNYKCGPASIPPDESGWYIVRPIMNLSGMGVGAKKMWLKKGDYSKVLPGYFWCEWFNGEQISIDYVWDGKWVPVSCWKAHVDEDNLYKFKKWERCHNFIELDSFYDEIACYGVKRINIEFVNSNPIEVHLRSSPDPNYDELIPIWGDSLEKVEYFNKLGYTFMEEFDNGDGYLINPRIGFMVKNKEI